jgi:hypothetical protein
MRVVNGRNMFFDVDRAKVILDGPSGCVEPTPFSGRSCAERAVAVTEQCDGCMVPTPAPPPTGVGPLSWSAMHSASPSS